MYQHPKIEINRFHSSILAPSELDFVKIMLCTLPSSVVEYVHKEGSVQFGYTLCIFVVAKQAAVSE